MKPIDWIVLMLFSLTAVIALAIAGIYISIGWCPICSRLACVSMVTLLMLIITSMAQAETETRDYNETTEDTDGTESDS